ncbi:hypothetical protein D9758_004549 [Tetrapyrgos nigripes]|uniref:Uncharacterized protein n=1 Tax=Tetrapyrgos nigripes TaxID=182062 RepID=A0A8H5H081_9AGAR|nr:hypothetical protein D9758_004549 [Tetrapyrgos nigripes]
MANNGNFCIPNDQCKDVDAESGVIYLLCYSITPGTRTRRVGNSTTLSSSLDHVQQLVAALRLLHHGRNIHVSHCLPFHFHLVAHLLFVKNGAIGKQWRGYSKYRSMVGMEQALNILNDQETFERLVSYVKEEGIDCDLWPLDVAMTEEIAAQCAENYTQLQATRPESLRPFSNHLEQRSCILNAVSVFFWEAASFYPRGFVAYINNKCLAYGSDRFNSQTWTTLVETRARFRTRAWACHGSGRQWYGREWEGNKPEEEEQWGWTAETDRGSTTAQAVVFASNACTAALLPEFEGVIVPHPICTKLISPPPSSGSRALQNTYGVLAPHPSSTTTTTSSSSSPNPPSASSPSSTALSSINPRPPSDGIVLCGGSNLGERELIKWVKEYPEDRATIFTAAPGLVHLIQGGTWDEGRDESPRVPF